MIEIDNLKKNYGETVACNIEHFTIHDGEMLGLVGNNGAGKSTLFRMMLDLVQPDEGVVKLDGIIPSESEEWKDWTGAFVDQGFLIDYLTPDEYFEFVGNLVGLNKQQVIERVGEYDDFMAGEILGKKKLIRDLSAGNQQKVGIVAAMITQPKLLVLDEPFNFLDPSSQNHLKHMLTDYCQRQGATILVSSHNLEHTINICGRIALLEHGVIIRDIDNRNGAARQELARYFEMDATDKTTAEGGKEEPISAQATDLPRDNMEELLPLVDADGAVIGSATRRHCHTGSFVLHPVVHLHLFNSDGALYLQRRPQWKDIQPGKWDTAVGGHVSYGEAIEDALKREVEEEIGLNSDDYQPEFIEKYDYRSQTEYELVHVYKAVSNVLPKPTAELDGGQFFTPEEIKAKLGTGFFTPNFEEEWNRIFC